MAQAQTPEKLVGNDVGGSRFDGNLAWDRAQAFTTGSHALGYKLTRLDLRMRNTAAAEPTYSVSIHSDTSTGCGGGITSCPGTKRGTLNNPSSLPASNTWVQFTASGGGIDLAKDTKYWVVIDRTAGDGTSTISRVTASGNEEAGAATGWSIANGSISRPASVWNQTHTQTRLIAVYGYAKTAVTGVAFEEQQQVVKRTLAEVASRTVSGALDNIGTRLGDAVPASGLNLGGMALAGPNLAGPNPAGRPAPSGWAGFDGPWDRHGPDDAWPSGGGHGRGMTPSGLLGSGAFSYALGAAEGDKESNPNALRWGVWGRGDFGTFAGRTSEGPGEVRTGVHATTAISAPAGWARTRGEPGGPGAGSRASRCRAGRAETDYVLDGEEGRIETDLTALWPYGRWTFANGLEMRGLLGVGRGEARHTAEDGTEEKSDLSMWAASAGFSRPLPPMAGIDLSARGDASVAFMETEHGDGAVDGLSADVSRVRGGVEASKRIAMADGASLTPFAELAGRMDGGDGVTGPGVEVAGGLRYAGPRVAVEVRGRWLAAHAEAGTKERGVSLTARLDPGALGRGLSMSLAPRWGAPADGPLGGTSALWREELPRGGSGDSAGGFEGELGYGLPAFGGRFTGTPNVGFGASDGGGRDYRVGWRLTPAVPGYAGFRVDLDATRRESAGTGAPAHGAMLTGVFRW